MGRNLEGRFGKSMCEAVAGVREPVQEPASVRRIVPPVGHEPCIQPLRFVGLVNKFTFPAQ